MQWPRLRVEGYGSVCDRPGAQNDRRLPGIRTDPADQCAVPQPPAKVRLPAWGAMPTPPPTTRYWTSVPPAICAPAPGTATLAAAFRITPSATLPARFPSTGGLPYQTAFISASANSVTSNPVEVYVHAPVSSVALATSGFGSAAMLLPGREHHLRFRGMLCVRRHAIRVLRSLHGHALFLSGWIASGCHLSSQLYQFDWRAHLFSRHSLRGNSEQCHQRDYRGSTRYHHDHRFCRRLRFLRRILQHLPTEIHLRHLERQYQRERDPGSDAEPADHRARHQWPADHRPHPGLRFHQPARHLCRRCGSGRAFLPRRSIRVRHLRAFELQSVAHQPDWVCSERACRSPAMPSTSPHPALPVPMYGFPRPAIPILCPLSTWSAIAGFHCASALRSQLHGDGSGWAARSILARRTPDDVQHPERRYDGHAEYRGPGRCAGCRPQ